MKNQWIHIFSGTVKVKLTGKGIERFLNQLTKNGVSIWNVRKHGSEAVTFYVNLQDVKKLRIPARDSNCKIRFLERAGGPFFLSKLWTNSGFFIGACLFLGLIMLLSNMVWGIEIRGANPATEHHIRKELDKMGISVGKMQFSIDNVESVQRELTDKIGALTWIGVELKGTTYHFQVVEKSEPKKAEVIGPRHLIAKRKAAIVKIFVEKGEPVVKVNDYVLPGQLLVSGLYGNEDDMKTVAASGEILGETWYSTKVELPLKSTFQVFNGSEKRKYSLKIAGRTLPVWGFGDPDFKEYETEVNDHPIKFFKWELPLMVEKKTLREREEVTRIYSREEAVESAKELARKDIKNHLPENAIIKGEKILHQSIENDKVKLTTHFTIIEDIAVGQPISQGD
ncbi:sporulation protein YqfD [Mesobacillus subterraneus]|uniref:sporulation protein YqfD n=1 Tax=Mesobacillus subterraneus TaxID=285983 RepID=UPI00203E4F51|nr:sporulation protein YqfD [Mesobacillus subterraneus]MCM3663960.1 sporulation protein YqfD [Mesobacillus subterraneus]MCM3683719.1 sporulation protein YqfD [Mesobacillus subterraneus]